MVKVYPVHLSSERYKGVWMFVEQIVELTFALQDVYSSNANLLVVMTYAIPLDYCNEMVAVTKSAECDPTDSSIKDSVAEKRAERS